MKSFFFVLSCILAAAFLGRISVNASAPPESPKPAKTLALTSDQAAALTFLNTRAAALQQESRAVQAEREILQSQANAFLEAACKKSGGSKCHIDGTNLVIDK